MNDPILQEWLDISWSRPLSDQEKARLDAYLNEHPERLAEWRAEQQLDRCLARLPAPSVSSNFTARVLQEVSRSPARHVPIRPWLREWLSPVRWPVRIACAGAIAGIGLLGWVRYQDYHREQMAETVAAVSAIPNLDVLKNYEAIQRLGQLPPGTLQEEKESQFDTQLLMALREDE